MTHVTSISSGNVGRIFADCNNTVVARLTITQHLAVIHSYYGHPHISGMTGFTNIGGTHMRCTPAGR